MAVAGALIVSNQLTKMNKKLEKGFKPQPKKVQLSYKFNISYRGIP